MQLETLCGTVAAAQLSEIRDNATPEEGETLSTLNIAFCLVLLVSFYVAMTLSICSSGPVCVHQQRVQTSFAGGTQEAAH